MRRARQTYLSPPFPQYSIAPPYSIAPLYNIAPLYSIAPPYHIAKEHSGEGTKRQSDFSIADRCVMRRNKAEHTEGFVTRREGRYKSIEPLVIEGAQSKLFSTLI